MARPVCLHGTYALGVDVFTVLAITLSMVVVVDGAGHQSQVHRETFDAHFVAVP